MPDFVEKEAPSVEEALFAGAMSLGISESEAQVQVLASTGAGRVKVRIGKPGVVMPQAPAAPEEMSQSEDAAATTFEKPKDYAPRNSRRQPTSDELAQVLSKMEQLLNLMGTPGKIEVKERLDNKILNISSEFEGLLIGKRGMTLDSLQEMALRFLDGGAGRSDVHVVVDVADYRGRHEEELLSYAKELAAQAQDAGQVSSKPLNPADRRIVHLSLKGVAGVDTWSVGEGAMKKVVVQKKA